MKHRLNLAAVFVLVSAFLHPPLSAFAQNTAFTYQGRMQDNGTNFTGTGLFQFALVTSSNVNQTATATVASPTSGFITTITVTTTLVSHHKSGTIVLMARPLSSY